MARVTEEALKEMLSAGELTRQELKLREKCELLRKESQL